LNVQPIDYVLARRISSRVIVSLLGFWFFLPAPIEADVVTPSDRVSVGINVRQTASGNNQTALTSWAKNRVKVWPAALLCAFGLVDFLNRKMILRAFFRKEEWL
jgi:hypothetical protein